MSSDIDIPSDTNLSQNTTEINKNANKTQQQQSNIQQHIQKQANKMKNTARTQRKRNNTGMLNIDSHSQVLRSKWSTKYHIFNDKNTEYSILMNQTDISFGHRGHNKFYAIQLLEHNQGNEYRFVTKWGRVGQNGQISHQDFSSKTFAIATFAKKFKDKTKNDWGADVFTPVKNKYIPISMAAANTLASDSDSDSKSDSDMNEMDTNEDDIKSDIEEDIPLSKLPQKLIQMLSLIFDRQLQISTAEDLNIDLNQMPLGQLSKAQINKGYNILCRINDILVGNKDGFQVGYKRKILKLSSDFYTIIPHNFGMRRPPMISNSNILHQKIELIECLKEMLITNSILKKRSKRMNPIDVHYNALHCDIHEIHVNSNEYSFIAQSLNGTHAETHNGYTLDIIDIFHINRHRSQFRHLPFRTLFASKTENSVSGEHCCKLLWHGSRLSNFVGILSQGLRIAPPEAPSTGYMFGKGLYFADCASKSANYVRATRENPYGLLILAEVAVGCMYPLLEAKYMNKPPLGYHSVVGVGKNIPQIVGGKKQNNEFVADLDDYELFLGPIIANKDENVQQNSELLYNEYIVYDVAQVCMKYLVLVRFKFENED